MLVLSREAGEQIVLSRDGVEIGRILVVELARSRVRLGFVMPNDVTIDRLEIHRAKERSRAEREAQVVCSLCQGPIHPGPCQSVTGV